MVMWGKDFVFKATITKMLHRHTHTYTYIHTHTDTHTHTHTDAHFISYFFRRKIRSKTKIYLICEQQGGLFVEYMNTFLKLKVQASGYSNHVASEQDKYHYITEFYSSDGILLVRANIVKKFG